MVSSEFIAVPAVSTRCQHLLVVGGNEPQLHVRVASSFLSSDELQHILVSHPIQAEDLVLILPRLLVLSTHTSTVRGSKVTWSIESMSSKQVQRFQQPTHAHIIYKLTTVLFFLEHLLQIKYFLRQQLGKNCWFLWLCDPWTPGHVLFTHLSFDKVTVGHFTDLDWEDFHCNIFTE